jgi:DNA-binding XRE family transcriptional regulator
VELIQTIDSNDNAVEGSNIEPVMDRDGVALPQHMQQAILNGKHPVKIWRLHRDLSMGDLAKLVNVSTATIFYIEKNNQPADASLIEKLAEVLNAHPEDLIPS